MLISLINTCTNDGIDIYSCTGVSNTNDTNRTSIKQQQQEEIKLQSQVEICANSSADSEAQQTNVSCSTSSVSQQAVTSWQLTVSSWICSEI